MPIRHLKLRVAPADQGQRLDHVLHHLLEESLGRRVSRSAVRRMIMAGAVRVGGRPTRRPGARLDEGVALHAALDEGKLAHQGGDEGAVPEVRILFEDEVLIAVAKPAGLQVHASADPSRPDLFAILRRRLRQREPQAYLGLHHRLDRETSGVVLFAKAESANASLARQFERREVEKVYHAVTVRLELAPAFRGGRREGRWRVESRLALVGKGRSARVASVESEGQAAATNFRVLRALPSALLVEARPETGRKHQVRAHLRESGMPIIGDARYGGPTRLGDLAVSRAMLHAYRLAFRHPVTGAPLEVTCEYPADFAEVLERLMVMGAAPVIQPRE